jgi:hypothetical protein
MRAFSFLIKRSISAFTLILVAAVLAVPVNVSAKPLLATVVSSDGFNTCTLNSSWESINPSGNGVIKVDQAFTNDSNLFLRVPAGRDYTFSDKNMDAPRVMQTVNNSAASEGSFEVEVKFDSALGNPAPGTWNIQGILVEDPFTVAGKSQWLRFDLNAKNDGTKTTINYYIGFIDADNGLHAIIGPSEIAGATAETAPLYLRVKYDQPTNQWSMGYGLGTNENFQYWKTFPESAPLNYTTPINFVVGRMGLFAGNTKNPTIGNFNNPPAGFTSQIDYIRDLTAPTFVDEPYTITVTTSGSGRGHVDFPITDPSTQCPGNSVILTASPMVGSDFESWSGDATGSDPAVTLTMNKSYVLDARFREVIPAEELFTSYLPMVAKGE